MKVVIIDSTNHVIRYFKTYHEAYCFKETNGRRDWKIILYYPADYKSTPRQQSAVKWVEHILGIRFTGKINSGLSCSEFLSQYLELAKQQYTELKSDYESFNYGNN